MPSPADPFSHQLWQLHNQKRKEHGSPELRWSNELAEAAQSWADRLAKQAHLSFCEQSGVGENITFFPSTVRPETIIEHWYAEHVKYEYETPGWQAGTNYFTQIVWKATNEIGIGTAIVRPEAIDHQLQNQLSVTKPPKKDGYLADAGEKVVVAFYRPSGNNNRSGLFAANVRKPIE